MSIERIIFIDDDKVNNSLSRIIVRQAFGTFDTVTFEKPIDALAYIQQEYSDSKRAHGLALVLLDINMPVMNGWTFLDKVADLPEHVQQQLRIYILSSSIDPRDKERAEMHALVHGYISKPLASGVLRELVFPGELQSTTSKD